MSAYQTEFKSPGRLTSALAGKVVIPEHARFDEARRAFNLAIDQRPAAVVFPESPQDVAAAVLFARESGLRVAAQGTGHNAGPLGSLADTILLKTERMRGVWIDPARRTARVQAGTLWAEVVGAAAQHGLAALAGSSPNVGVVGYTLGGGISFLGRKYGLAANRVRVVELHPERVIVRRALGGIKMAVNVPLAAYRGVAIRIEKATLDCAAGFAVVLEHVDPALSLTLYRAEDGSDVVAEWGSWARALGMPLLVPSSDSDLREAFDRMGGVRVECPSARRSRHGALKARRGMKVLRRRSHPLAMPPKIHRGEREIIARN